MQDIDLSLLRSFVILAQTQSFTRTAQKVGRSQSAISMQIAKLEDMLGTRLCNRDRGKVSLTADGEQLLGYAHNILTQSDRLIERFRAPDIAGEIRFGSPEDFATRYLPDILASFSAAHPGIALNVNCDLTLNLINGLENGQYDLIIIKQEPDRRHEGAQALWREALVWAASAGANARASSMESIKETGKPLPLILSPAPCVYRARATDALDGAGIAWKIAYTSPSFAGSVAAVKAGLGYTVLPRNMVPADLVALDEAAGWPALRDTEICLLARDERNQAIAALADYIHRQL